MQWKGRRSSRNIEDRRSQGTRGGVARIGGAGALIVVLLAVFLGIDPSQLLQGLEGGNSPGGAPVELTAQDRAEGEFVSVVLADTETIWAGLFRDQLGQDYTPATLVLFKTATASPCGGASEATGPFYCPADNKVYLDTAFFTTLQDRLGAAGDFAAAYVVAHEIGHHVQDALGILSEANALRARASPRESNQISVMIELQADCLSGIWAKYADLDVDRRDLQEAVNAARQIGDDTLQRSAGQRPMPHTFTHGTADQRARWFETGYRTGKISSCDTFSARNL